MTNLETLINILFNLGFKRCKYCNKLFYPQHNRQVHCKRQHRIWYMNERKRERRRNERKQDPIVEFIDGHGKFIRMSSRHLNEVGSMFTREEYHRKINFQEELQDVRKQVQALGLRR